MTYSTIGILAIIIVIINQDQLSIRKRENETTAYRYYRWFLYAVLAYLLTDAFWGILYELHSGRAAFIDTEINFAAMAVAVFFWTRYVISYLEEFDRKVEANTRIGQVVIAAGPAEYRTDADRGVRTVFERADRHMYERKQALKRIESEG